MTDQTVGKNGVVITRRFSSETPAYRTYEVFQRERVGESTEKIKPKQLMSADYQVNPYPLLEILRENYPCYRDWLSNSYWITRYDDVTSIFADDANFETRSKAWYYGIEASGTDLRDELALTQVEEGVIDEHTENISRTLVSDIGGPSGGGKHTHAHAYLTADNRNAIYNAPTLGTSQVCAARVPDGFLESLG